MTDLLIPRRVWGSTFDYGKRHRQQFRSAPTRKAETVLHTTVTVAPDLHPPFGDEHAAMRLLERIGVQRFGSGLSYNAVVMPTGKAYEGQPLDNKSTHSEFGDWNYTRASIALCGDYSKDRPTQEMLDTVAAIQAEWKRRGIIGTVQLRGHFEVSPKSCPGKFAIRHMGDIATAARALLKPPLPEVSLSHILDAYQAGKRSRRPVWSREVRLVQKALGMKLRSGLWRSGTRRRFRAQRGHAKPTTADLVALGKGLFRTRG